MSNTKIQIHKKVFGFGVAATSIVVSFCLWTSILYGHTYSVAIKSYEIKKEDSVAVSVHQVATGSTNAVNVLAANVIHDIHHSEESIEDEQNSDDVDKESAQQLPIIDSFENIDVENREQYPQEIEHGSAPEIDELPSIQPKKFDSIEDDWELQRGYTISIPKLAIHAPVYIPSMRYWNDSNWDLLEEQMQVGLSLGTVAYPHSVAAGTNGNIIIAGHSSPPNELARASDFGSVFAKLPEVNIGDTISILKNNSYIDYKITNKTVVSSESTHILQPQYEQSILKLITCFPVGTTRDRLVITAELSEAG